LLARYTSRGQNIIADHHFPLTAVSVESYIQLEMLLNIGILEFRRNSNSWISEIQSIYVIDPIFSLILEYYL